MVENPGAREDRRVSHYLLQFFAYSHLREDLRETSEQFAELAQRIDIKLPDNPEKTTALRKLLEAKDCAVRAWLFAHDLTDLKA
jgi:ferritin-like protein